MDGVGALGEGAVWSPVSRRLQTFHALCLWYLESTSLSVLLLEAPWPLPPGFVLAMKKPNVPHPLPPPSGFTVVLYRPQIHHFYSPSFVSLYEVIMFTDA